MRETGRNNIRILIGVFMTALLVGCGQPHHDERLLEVAREISDSLKRAETLLKEIDKEELNNADRHFYDFLNLKIDDKNYVRHTSDSLYLSIKEYYSDHKNDALFPEVLYYGGRVYSDMGDYPTALKYFQESLDALPEDTPDLDLKSRILSQTGRLLNQLRLYSEAESYLEKAVEIDRGSKNHEDIVYNLQLLGIINYNLNNFAKAKKYLQEALTYCETLPPSFTAKTQMHLARTDSKLGNHTEAIALIRLTPDKVKSISKDWAIAYAAEIYYAGGVFDTAYIYAKRIIDNPQSLKKKTGYKILLTPELTHYIPKDSLVYYVSQYNKCIEEYLDRNDVSQVLLQLSFYNYQKKETAVEEISNSRFRLIVWGGGIILLLVISLVVLGILRINNKRHLKEFESVINKIKSLYKMDKEEIIPSNYSIMEGSVSSTLTGNNNSSVDMEFQAVLTRTEEEKRLSELKESLMTSADNKTLSIPALPSELISSEVYTQLQEYIKTSAVLTKDDSMWDKLEEEINLYYPNFTNKLSELMNRKETVQEIQTCLLIKLQLPAKVIAQLLAISPGGLGSRRDSISKKMFGYKLGATKTDIVIRLL